MKVLVLGGTGAMGYPLAEILSKDGNSVYVTSRKQHDDKENIHYLLGNAKDDLFMKETLDQNFDVIVDFMKYQTEEFKQRCQEYLDHTGQYVFLSSSRVYADNGGECITETSPRLLDNCNDTEYINTDEYALAKAREEDRLFSSARTNWTIIRPYVTYNDYRLQLGVYEKEQWLRRPLNGKSIVFPRDMAEKTTTLTYGNDVAGAICRLIDNPKSYGEVFQITNTQNITWGEVLNVYLRVMKSKLGIEPCIIMPDNSQSLQKYWNPWQIKYDRLFNRKFDNSKLFSVIGDYQFVDTCAGLSACLQRFLEKPVWRAVKWDYEIWADTEANEWTKLSTIPGKKRKLRYLMKRIIGHKH